MRNMALLSVIGPTIPRVLFAPVSLISAVPLDPVPSSETPLTRLICAAEVLSFKVPTNVSPDNVPPAAMNLPPFTATVPPCRTPPAARVN